ncbi:MAG: exosome complex protein Rrp42 [Candidatus Aenigmatarchaeota archaeon]
MEVLSMKGDYMKKLILAGTRADGRPLDAFRKVTVEKGVVKTAEGSARVTMGKTQVVAGIKMDAAEPYPDTPNEGNLVVDAEFVPFANPDFEPGPPDENAVELARVVDRGIRECRAIDTEKLVIVPKELVWSVHIDIHAINDDGNLQDASSLAAIAALQDCKIPEYDAEKKQVVKEMTAVVSSGRPLPLRDTPVEVTVHKIGGKLFIDPTIEEEEASDAHVTIATTEAGDLCAMQKGGKGAFTAEELLAAARMSIEKGRDLRAALG